jgi:outer membrane protein assembly factor BamB
MHGPGAAPVLYQNLAILIQDQHNADSVFVAVDKETGEVVWQKKRDRNPCWSTPMIVRVGDHDELLYNGSHQIIGYDPATGEELWRVNGSSRESVPNLVIGGGWIFSASGRNGPYLAIRPGGQGDVTASHVVWKTRQGGAHVPSPVYCDGHLFAVNDVGIAACLDAKTGRIVWQQRLAGRFTTSPLLAGDTLIATNEEGKTYLIKAADGFELLSENDLAETVYASPALLEGKLYFRTAENVICIGE